MKVTTELTGNRTKVVVEESGNQANAIRTAELTVDGSGLLSYSAFKGKSIGFIKQYFKGEIDGDNIIGRDATTLDSDGVLDLGQVYAGQTVYLTQLGETFYTSDAKEYADQAEASADNAATSAVDAQTAQTEAETAETNAAASASAASTSETNAANSASAAATSETNAASSASAASTSETNAANSASAASTSETNAANSASAASTSETNAATSATEAEAARDEIVDKIPFDDYSDGQLAKWNASTEQFDPISPELLGAQRELFKRSFPAQMVDYDNLHLWGPPDAPYSGQTPAASFDDFDYKYNFTASGGPNVGVRIKILIQNGFSNSNYHFVGFGIDENNFYKWRINRAECTLFKVESGVSTELFSGGDNFDFIRTGSLEAITINLTTLGRGNMLIREYNNGAVINNNFDLDPRNFTFFAFGWDASNYPIKSALVEGDRIVSIP